MALSHVNFLNPAITRLPDHSTFTDKTGIVYIRNAKTLTILPAPLPRSNDEGMKVKVWCRCYETEEEAVDALSTFLTTGNLPEHGIPAPLVESL